MAFGVVVREVFSEQLTQMLLDRMLAHYGTLRSHPQRRIEIEAVDVRLTHLVDAVLPKVAIRQWVFQRLT